MSGASLIPTDTPGEHEDVSDLLSIARVTWNRGDHDAAVNFVQRAAQTAMELELEMRGLELAKIAAELKASVSQPPPAVAPSPGSMAPAGRAENGAPSRMPPSATETPLLELAPPPRPPHQTLPGIHDGAPPAPEAPSPETMDAEPVTNPYPGGAASVMTLSSSDLQEATASERDPATKRAPNTQSADGAAQTEATSSGAAAAPPAAVHTQITPQIQTVAPKSAAAASSGSPRPPNVAPSANPPGVAPRRVTQPPPAPPIRTGQTRPPPAVTPGPSMVAPRVGTSPVPGPVRRPSSTSMAAVRAPQTPTVSSSLAPSSASRAPLPLRANAPGPRGMTPAPMARVVTAPPGANSVSPHPPQVTPYAPQVTPHPQPAHAASPQHGVAHGHAGAGAAPASATLQPGGPVPEGTAIAAVVDPQAVRRSAPWVDEVVSPIAASGGSPVLIGLRARIHFRTDGTLEIGPDDGVGGLSVVVLPQRGEDMTTLLKRLKKK